jgi:hypothetical protein
VISQEVREEVRGRFDFRCGYCGVSETDIGAPLTIDHFKPRSRGGSDEPDNLVYCCFSCNINKGDYWSLNPSSMLLHPQRDNLSAHIEANADGTLNAITAAGQVHIERLRLNRHELVAYRLASQRRQDADEALNESLAKLEALRQRVSALEQDLAEAERRLTSL